MYPGQLLIKGKNIRIKRRKARRAHYTSYTKASIFENLPRGGRDLLLEKKNKYRKISNQSRVLLQLKD